MKRPKFVKPSDNKNVPFQVTYNKLLRTTVDEIRKFVDITPLMSNLVFPKIIMY